MQFLFQLRASARLGVTLFTIAAGGMALGQATFAYTDVHNMYPATIVEQNPYGGVTFDSSGNAYGTTRVGGQFGGGCLWELANSGSFNVLHNFGGTVTNADGSSGTDGTGPFCNVTVDSHGNLFGTASAGGPNGAGIGGYGMAWELTSGGVYVDLRDFGGSTTVSNGQKNGNDGTYPHGLVAVDSSGDLFGTTSGGGLYLEGMLWEITSGGTYKDLHDFGGPITLASGSSGIDGSDPMAGPTLDSSGNLYGTAYTSGTGLGMVWEFTSGASYRDLHDFGDTITLSNGTSGQDGYSPVAGVTLDSSRNLYGCASQGGGTNNDGMVWELTSGGIYRDLHDFGYSTTLSNGATGTDGSSPNGYVTFDSSGNIFGTAENGGEYSEGIVWEIKTGGKYIDQHDFGGNITYPDGSTGVDGENPVSGVTFDSTGKLWGTTSQGANAGSGLIYTMVSLTISDISLSPPTIVGGYSSTVTVNLNGIVQTNTTVTLTNQWPGYVSVPPSVTVLAGSSSVTFTASVSKLYAATFTDLITATLGTSSQNATLTVTGEKLSSLTLSPSTIGGVGTSTGTLTITNPAPPGGWAVNLKSALPSYVSVPSTVTVAAGATTANFTLTGLGAHVSSVTCSIYATDVASGTSASITLQGDSIASLSLNQSTIGWSGSSTGTVSLNAPAPPGGWVVNLSAGASGYLTMPSSVTVLEGTTSVTFSISGESQRKSSLSIRINASDGATGAFAVLNLVGDSLSNLSLSPASVTPGHGSTGTITLGSAAPFGGWKVNLTVGAPSLVGVPASVTVPAGATSVTFPLVTYIGEPATSVSIFANDGTSQEQTTLTIT